jgi:hypothetical protein
VPAVARLPSAATEPLWVATATSLFAERWRSWCCFARGEVGVLFQRSTGPRLALVGALGTAAAFFLFYAGTSRRVPSRQRSGLQVEADLWRSLRRGSGSGIDRRSDASPRFAVLLAGLALALGAQELLLDRESG